MLLWLPTTYASAQTVPGPADAGRVKPEEKFPAIDRSFGGTITIPSETVSAEIPAGAEQYRFTLREVHIVGSTVFSEDEFKQLYVASIDQEISLANAYEIAAKITNLYRKEGYFLSRAYVPAQEIGNGVLNINIIEGYVGEVTMEDTHRRWIVRAYIDRLMAEKPLKAQQLERLLLQLNHLPGYKVTGVLTHLDHAPEGAVRLVLETTRKHGNGQVSFDNYASRFLGPHATSASYTTSLVPLQQTSVSGLVSIPTKEIAYGTVNHAIAIAPDITWDVTASATKAEPGYTLTQFDVESDSIYLATSLSYQWICQRREELTTKLTLDGRNSASDLLGASFTRDRIRALRMQANYRLNDDWSGYNMANLVLSRGIKGLGASEAGNRNLSRAQADPGFTKAELSLSRLQRITPSWSMLFSAAGQYSNDMLFSAEEFGYGGQAFGRAYDASEITGDRGAAGSLELRYGFEQFNPITVEPYAFYDVGIVWNDDAGQTARASGTSAGFGMRASIPSGISGNLGVAWPLTRDVGTPIYGEDRDGARVLLQVSYGF